MGNIKVQLRHREKVKSIMILVPEEWTKIDWRELSASTPPHADVGEIIRGALAGIVRRAKRVHLTPYAGSGADISSDSWTSEKTPRHLLRVAGRDYLCPCARGAECLRPK